MLKKERVCGKLTEKVNKSKDKATENLLDRYKKITLYLKGNNSKIEIV